MGSTSPQQQIAGSAAATPNTVGDSGEGATQSTGQQPNPNNPSEYCSTIPPLQQAVGYASSVSATTNSPLRVMVPTGVLRKEGASFFTHSSSLVMCCILSMLDFVWFIYLEIQVCLTQEKRDGR